MEGHGGLCCIQQQHPHDTAAPLYNHCRDLVITARVAVYASIKDNGISVKPQ